MSAFISGAVCLRCLVVALFFLRFWKETGDRLFAMFGIAFAALGANRIPLALSPGASRGPYVAYLMRLLAFLIILAAILDKNRGKR